MPNIFRRIKDWCDFQHYKSGPHAKNAPEWIKLYPRLLNDMEWNKLGDKEKAILVELWMLASERGGVLPNIEVIAFRLRRPDKEIRTVLDKLPHWIENEAISERYDASRQALDGVYTPSSPEEKRREGEREENKNVKSREKSKEGFQREHEFMKTFWPAYPHKVGKGEARNAFRKARDKVGMAEIMAGVENYVRCKPPDRQWCNPATWLNQERWLDELAVVSAPQSRTMSALAELEEETLGRTSQRNGRLESGQALIGQLSATGPRSEHLCQATQNAVSRKAEELTCEDGESGWISRPGDISALDSES